MSNSNTSESMANRKSMSDEEIMQKIAELEEDSDCDNLSILLMMCTTVTMMFHIILKTSVVTGIQKVAMNLWERDKRCAVMYKTFIIQS